jgi:polyprenyl-phospho-N-acetylgalactosaminyl synthase
MADKYKQSSVVIVVPVYNEGTVIKKVVNGLEKHYNKIVCVNDGSTDNSSSEVLKTGAMLVEHPINMGAGAATQTGVDFALLDPQAEYFVTFDGDGQHMVADIEPMINHLVKNNLDVVFGSRFLGTIENISPIKAAFLKIAEFFNRFTTKTELSDPHIGLRVFNRKFAQSLEITLHGFAHASEIVEHIAVGKYKYGEYPVTVVYSDYSKKKGQPMLNAINIVFDLIMSKASKK